MLLLLLNPFTTVWWFEVMTPKNSLYFRWRNAKRTLQCLF